MRSQSRAQVPNHCQALNLVRLEIDPGMADEGMSESADQKHRLVAEDIGDREPEDLEGLSGK